ncbi:MAG TPA: hypothetical protein VH740_26765 [Vicinamibacterales bacterium]|jgi:hypothetical protein
MDALIAGLALVVSAAGATAPAPDTHSPAAIVAPQSIRQAMQATELRPDPDAAMFQRLPGNILGLPHTTTFRPRHVKNPRMRATIAGAGLGMLAGAVIGYVVTNRSNCDMCGFAGLTFGVPIGGVAGSMLGWHGSR